MLEQITQFIGQSCLSNDNTNDFTNQHETEWNKLNLANTGKYNSNDIVLLSGSNIQYNITLEDIENKFNSFYLPLIIKARKVNANFIIKDTSTMNNIVKQYLLFCDYKEVKKEGYSLFNPPKYGDILIANKKTISAMFNYEDIYVGRPSILGNPYNIDKQNNREEVIKGFQSYLINKIKLFLEKPDIDCKVSKFIIDLAKKVRKGRNIRLICWCTPKKCHAEVIKKVIYWLIFKGVV